MHDIKTITDPDGRSVTGVALKNRPGERAWLFTSDYERITADLGTPAWFANSNGKGKTYVRLRHPVTGTNTMLSRMVAGDFLRSFVRHRDGVWTNLRGTNLEIDNGSGGVPKRRRSRNALRCGLHIPVAA